jgi:S1-C subfamily serine protease
MKCPKCNHEQSNTFECESCGIIFEKYARRQKMDEESCVPPSEENSSREETSDKKGLMLTFIYPVAAIVVIFCIYLYFSPSDKKIKDLKAGSDHNADVKIIVVNKTEPSLRGIAKQLNDAHPPKNNIEKARNATVFIKTAWGIGSGFFIDSNCHIITNRHVVMYDETEIASIRDRLNKQKLMIDNEEQRISRAENKVNTIRDYNYRRQVKEEIEKRKEQLSQARTEYEDYISTLDDIEYGFAGREFSITLIDGSEYSVMDAEKSETYDLALLSLGERDCPYIEAGSTKVLEQGKRVYTIGSPVGLKYTVTSGIVSGKRAMGDTTYIQTDASINPGNSGGPLINSDGKVIGVNTMVIRDAENIGFALPIESVLEEFGRFIRM